MQRAEGVGRDVVQPVVAHLKPFQVTCRSEGLAIFFLFFYLEPQSQGLGILERILRILESADAMTINAGMSYHI